MQNIKAFLENLSHHPGVYQMLDEKGQVIYIGKAKNLKKRISSYFNKQTKDQKTRSLVQQVDSIEVTITHNENEAVLLECNFIKKHHPRYNVLLRDDKSYPYIMITNQHAYPRIDLYRGMRKKNALYYGPYPSAKAVRETISLLQKVFQLRTCRDTYFKARTRPCLLYQIGRCTGPCVELISRADYHHQVELAILFLEGKSHQVIEELQTKMEEEAHLHQYESASKYRDQINRLRQIQDRQYADVSEGDADILGCAVQSGVACVQLLTIRHGQMLDSRSYFPETPKEFEVQEVLSAFLTQHYLSDVTHIESIPKQIIIPFLIKDQDWIQTVLGEQAKHKVTIISTARGEKKKWLEMAMASAKQSLSGYLFTKLNINDRMMALKTVLKLNKLPERIECFDISHTSGEATVGSCVVFDREGAKKAHYRRYNITQMTKGDDLAAMQEVLERRFKPSQKEMILPDVVLIDGGKNQLAIAHAVLQAFHLEGVHLVGVAKGNHRKPGFETLHTLHEAPIHLSADSQALHLIQQIRDEAHRFAITGHRQRRDKIRRHSVLETIPGVGAKRRRDLLRYFGGIQGVAHASLDELAKVPGISLTIAERIFAALHDTTL